MFARRPHIDGVVIVETHAHFSGAFAAHWAVWDMRQIGTNPAVVLQIGGRSYALSAADFFAVSMQEIGAFRTKSEIADFGRKGRNFGGQD